VRTATHTLAPQPSTTLNRRAAKPLKQKIKKIIIKKEVIKEIKLYNKKSK
jgi:hypothetical protein